MDQLRDRIEGLKDKIKSLTTQNGNLVTLVRERLQHIIDRIGSINYGTLKSNFDELMENLATIDLDITTPSGEKIDLQDTPLGAKINEISVLCGLIRHQLLEHEDIHGRVRQESEDEYRRLLMATQEHHQIESGDTAYDELNDENTKLHDDIKELKRTIKKLTDENETLKRRLKLLEEMNTRVNSENGKLKSDNQNLTQQLKECNEHNEELERNLEDIKGRLTNLRDNQFDTLNDENAKLNGKIKRMDEDFEKEKASLTAQLQKCRDELNERLRQDPRAESLDRPPVSRPQLTPKPLPKASRYMKRIGGKYTRKRKRTKRR
jgi:chromosome segregation ATPase